MTFDLASATRFMTTHARLLERRRFDLLTGEGDADAVHRALDAYRNADGGFGWGFEPDLRSPESQPVGALHALEVLEETGGSTGPLSDWLASITLADGGLPFALPVRQPVGSAPWWVGADPMESSLHLTSVIVALAHRVARHDAELRAHPWLARSTEYCWRAITAMQKPESTYELKNVLWFLDSIAGSRPDAVVELERVLAWVPEDGVRAVEGGVEGEVMHPLDFSPWPDGPLRSRMNTAIIEPDLVRLAGLQRADDGGWTVNFASQTEAAALEWRGYATVGAVKILHDHGING
ncbi:hypothetical protein [Pseudonocardia spinosispora]|uniref:hypothetical protein n=1 Tax=Pseudonocardia spinosispora TaxID=103441 RepID=UPI00041858D0|nr:hypothetical protein [Pseudonocardia spinosispora]